MMCGEDEEIVGATYDILQLEPTAAIAYIVKLSLVFLFCSLPRWGLVHVTNILYLFELFTFCFRSGK